MRLFFALLCSLADDLFPTDTQANGFVNPDELELNDGDLSGLTLAPGLYKWGSNVILPTDLVFECVASSLLLRA